MSDDKKRASNIDVLETETRPVMDKLYAEMGKLDAPRPPEDQPRCPKCVYRRTDGMLMARCEACAALIVADAPDGKDCPHCGGGLNQWGHTVNCPVQRRISASDHPLDVGDVVRLRRVGTLTSWTGAATAPGRRTAGVTWGDGGPSEWLLESQIERVRASASAPVEESITCQKCERPFPPWWAPFMSCLCDGRFIVEWPLLLDAPRTSKASPCDCWGTSTCSACEETPAGRAREWERQCRVAWSERDDARRAYRDAAHRHGFPDVADWAERATGSAWNAERVLAELSDRLRCDVPGECSFCAWCEENGKEGSHHAPDWQDVKHLAACPLAAAPCASDQQTSESGATLSGERAPHEPDFSRRAEAPKSPAPISLPGFEMRTSEDQLTKRVDVICSELDELRDRLDQVEAPPARRSGDVQPSDRHWCSSHNEYDCEICREGAQHKTSGKQDVDAGTPVSHEHAPVRGPEEAGTSLPNAGAAAITFTAKDINRTYRLAVGACVRAIVALPTGATAGDALKTVRDVHQVALGALPYAAGPTPGAECGCICTGCKDGNHCLLAWCGKGPYAQPATPTPCTAEKSTGIVRGNAEASTYSSEVQPLPLAMTLDEAIVHANAKASEGGPCAADHSVLASWLVELRERRSAPSSCNADSVLARLAEWTFEYGEALKPTGADTYGEGVRACKGQVARILATLTKGSAR